MEKKEIALKVTCRGCGSYFHATGAPQCPGAPVSEGKPHPWCEKCEFFRIEGHTVHKRLVTIRGKSEWEIVE